MTPSTPPPEDTAPRAHLIFILGLIAAVVTFVVAVAGWRWAGSERADFAQWLMAGAAVTTLLAAIGAAVFAASAFRLESGREERYREDQQRHQAGRVAAWHAIGASELPGGGGHVITFLHDTIKARNSSDLPVTNVEFRLHLAGVYVTSQYQAVLPPAESPEEIPLTREVLDALRAHDRNFVDANAQMDRPDLTIDLSFVDSAGRRWARTYDGRLTAVL